MGRLARIAAAAALALLAGCVMVRYEHHRMLEPIAPERLDALRPGESDLRACLAALGAPLYVWEHRGDGLALGYGWQEARHWSAGVSVDVSGGANASFNYTDIDASTKGYVLFFDADWKLTAVREGNLRDITVGVGPQRAASVDS